jgi:hypothetical protein
MGPFGMASQVKEHLQPSQASATAALDSAKGQW